MAARALPVHRRPFRDPPPSHGLNATGGRQGCGRVLLAALGLIVVRAPQRRRQRALVEIIELAADGHAMGKPGDLDVQPLQLVGDVMGGGSALDGGVDGDDQLAHAAFARGRSGRGY